MQNCSTNSFAQALQQRGFIEKAHLVCASWQDGFVAQDADGAVFAYNTKIAQQHHDWQPTGKGIGPALHRLAKLTATELWRDHILPMQAIWQWQPGLSIEQQLFYKTLFNEGALAKARIFLTTWKKDAWIAMDADGAIFLYNGQPNKGAHMWNLDLDADDLNDFLILDKTADLQMNWDDCCVKLDALEAPCQPVAAGPIILPKLNIRGRMDCWI